MRYATVCSGIETPSVAWHPLGWSPAFFSEIEKAPCAVLADHYPDVPNYGDMAKWDTWPDHKLDLLAAGTPCQAFSVAGKRESLSDERGNLTLVFCRIADRYDPEWICWENVPGVLTLADNPFGCFLGELVGCDTAIVPGGIGWTSTGVVAGPKRTAAWRVIDAQGFVPQRRERVFVVCTRAGSRHHPADVLFETEAEAFGSLGERAYTGPLFPVGEGVRGDSAASGEARERASGSAARSVAIRGRDGTPQAELGNECANAILTPNGGRGGVGVGAVLAATAPTIPARTSGGGGLGTDFDCDGGLIAIPLKEPMSKGTAGALRNSECGKPGDPMFTLGAASQHGVFAPDIARCVATREGTSQDYETTIMVAHSLRADGFDASEDGTGRWTPLVPVAFAQNQREEIRELSVASSISSISSIRRGDAKNETLLAFQTRGSNLDTNGEISGTTGINGGSASGSAPCIAFNSKWSSTSGARFDSSEAPTLDRCKPEGTSIMLAMRVRRLMPIECERLQAFPDGYTAITYGNKPMSDGPRYKMLGNAMNRAVMAWIGQRIAALNESRAAA